MRTFDSSLKQRDKKRFIFFRNPVFWMIECLSWLLTPFVLIGWGVRFLSRKERGSFLKERLGLKPLVASTEKAPVIWLHGPSVGESMVFLGLLKVLLNTYPTWRFLLTTSTKTSADIWRKKIALDSVLRERVEHCMLLFENPFVIRWFVHRLKPCAFFLSESDFWPVLLLNLRNKKVPVVIFGAHLSEKSARRWRHAPFLLKQMLENTVCCVSSLDQQQLFKSFGVSQTMMLASLKWLGGLKTLRVTREGAAVMKQPPSFKTRLILSAVSTHEGEEEILFSVFEELKKQDACVLLVIAPRYVTRLPSLIKSARARGFSVGLWREAFSRESASHVDIVFVDHMGALSEVYALSRFVFVGGSLYKGMQGHNIIEPARFGCVVLHGPYMEKHASMAETFRKNAAALSVDTTTLREVLIYLLKHPLAAERLSKAAVRLTQSEEQRLTKEVRTLITSLQLFEVCGS